LVSDAAVVIACIENTEPATDELEANNCSIVDRRPKLCSATIRAELVVKTGVGPADKGQLIAERVVSNPRDLESRAGAIGALSRPDTTTSTGTGEAECSLVEETSDNASSCGFKTEVLNCILVI
jgi:hypothetical protein